MRNSFSAKGREALLHRGPFSPSAAGCLKGEGGVDADAQFGLPVEGILRARGKAARLCEALGKGEELVDV